MSELQQVRWCDGETLRSRMVAAWINDEGTHLQMAGEGVSRTVALTELRFADRLGRVPLFVKLPGGGVLEVPADCGLAGALAQVGGTTALERRIHWLESRAAVAAVATVLLVTAVGLAAWRGLPWLAERGARAVPAAVERQAGETALQVFLRSFPPSSLGEVGRDRVVRQLERLAAVRALHMKPRLVFVRMGAANAFALPGGVIVVTDELVQLAGSDDELAAVLAHELGHVELRHGLQSVLRNSAALVLVSTVTGDLSTVTTFSATLPYVLLQHGYSREFEREADAYAVDFLKQAKIEPIHLARILRRLERSRPKAGKDFSYLSTHPSTEDRVMRIAGGEGKLDAMVMAPEPEAKLAMPKSTTKRAAAEIKSDDGRKQAAVALDAWLQPKILHREKPVYPMELRKAGIEGQVTLNLSVNAEGVVELATVESTTDERFNEPALAAVQEWKFRPATLDGHPVRSRLRQEISFTLDEAPADQSVKE